MDEADIEAYRRDGVVCLRGLLDPAALALAAAAIAAVEAAPSWRAVTSDDGFFEDFCRWYDVPALGAIAASARLIDVAGALMGGERVRFHHDHVLVKEAGTELRTPWHQDQPYYDIDGRDNVSLWIPIDPVPVESSLEVVAGSHLGPWFVPRGFVDQEARWFPAGSLAEAPAVEADRASFPIRSWAVEPGDAVAFHMSSLHGAAGFRGPGRRRVLSLRYVGDDARHAARPWATSPHFPGLADVFADGAELDHPMFPLLR